jgi:hypothetical protein
VEKQEQNMEENEQQKPKQRGEGEKQNTGKTEKKRRK